MLRNIDSCEIEIEIDSLGRRATLVTTRPDLAHNAATLLFACEREEPAIAPFSPSAERKLIDDGFDKSLRGEWRSYCYAVIREDDREGLTDQLFDLMGAEHLLGRALHLRNWMTDPNAYAERSWQVSAFTLLAELERDIVRLRQRLPAGRPQDVDDFTQQCLFGEVDAIIRQLRKILPLVEWGMFRRRYVELVGDARVDAEAAQLLTAKAAQGLTDCPTAFQLSHGPDFLTVSLVDVIPGWTVVSVLTSQRRHGNLPFFYSESGMRFVAKNLNPPGRTGLEAPRVPGVLRFGDYVKPLEEGYMWLKTKALETRPEARSFCSAPTKQFVKLLEAPTGAFVGFI